MPLKEVQERIEHHDLEKRHQEYMAQVFPEIYRKLLPDIRRCMATDKALIDFVGCGDPFAVDEGSVSLCLDNPRENTNDTHTSLMAQIRGVQASPEQQRTEKIEAICELLKHNGPAFIRNERKRMSYWTLAALDKREAEIIAAQAGQSSNRARTYNQYEPLPSEGYVAIGKVRPSPWTFSLIKRLDRDETHRLIRRYGADAINQVCNLNKLRGIV